MIFNGFVGPAYEARSRYLDDQKCINWYVENDATPGAKVPQALMPSPGLQTYIDVPTVASVPVAPVRLLYQPSSRPQLLVAVVGNRVVTLLPSGTGWSTTVNTITSSTGTMQASDNGTEIVLVDGVSGWKINISTLAFATITDAAFSSASRVAHVDGYLLFNRPNTQVFYQSDLRATTFNALAFASKEAWPDLLQACWAHQRELWLLGQYSTEVWYNAGTTPLAFERNNGVFIQHGLAATNSLARIGETFAWLGSDERGSLCVWAANGYTPERISTPALETLIEQYAVTSDAVAFSFRFAGHEFYQLTFPTADVTWVYDLTTQLWHQRASQDALGILHRHRASCGVTYQGLSLVGDYLNGKVYQQRADVYTDDGTAIPRIRRCPHIIDDRRWVEYAFLQIEFEPGVGLPTGQGSNPQAMLRWSNDGGSTWSNERWQSIGQIGAYKNRAIWRRLGQSRDRVFEVRVTDPVKCVLIGASLNINQRIG